MSSQACITVEDVLSENVETKSKVEKETVHFGRELSIMSVFSIVLCIFVALTDVVKLCTSFAMKYYNDDRYPLDSSLVVLIVELLKCSVVSAIHVSLNGTNPFGNVDKRIFWPCAIYAVVNNVFFVALHFVSPAVWIVLNQLKLVFLLIIYRFAFARVITIAQWVGAILLIVGVGLTQASNTLEFSTLLPVLALALVSSLSIAVAGIYVEIVLKDGGDSELWRRQTHLYIGSACLSLIPLAVSNLYFKKDPVDILGSPSILYLLVVVSIGLTVVHGIGTSIIIKKLDNIVRFQISALVFVMTAATNKVFFPDKFDLNRWYVASLILVLYSVLLLERKKFF